MKLKKICTEFLNAARRLNSRIDRFMDHAIDAKKWVDAYPSLDNDRAIIKHRLSLLGAQVTVIAATAAWVMHDFSTPNFPATHADVNTLLAQVATMLLAPPIAEKTTNLIWRAARKQFRTVQPTPSA